LKEYHTVQSNSVNVYVRMVQEQRRGFTGATRAAFFIPRKRKELIIRNQHIPLRD
jgi:hypothetical protein